MGPNECSYSLSEHPASFHLYAGILAWAVAQTSSPVSSSWNPELVAQVSAPSPSSPLGSPERSQPALLARTPCSTHSHTSELVTHTHRSVSCRSQSNLLKSSFLVHLIPLGPHPRSPKGWCSFPLTKVVLTNILILTIVLKKKD